MSFDSISSSSESSASAPTLAVEIPVLYPPESEQSSVNSSLSSSPTNDKLVEKPNGRRGILELRTVVASTSSLPSQNVKFAPLPAIAPRRRRSTTPLGVAARGAMMRRRRGMLDPQDAENINEQEAENRRRAAAAHRQELDDPFLTLGKMVKGAWKKMNARQEKPLPPPKVVTGVTSTVPDVQEAEIFIRHGRQSSNGQGGVWEEEIVPRNVGQTDTFRETDTIRDTGETETIRDDEPQDQQQQKPARQS
ncbi:hypothetical protein BDZ89DRAFT_385454 [Hymenopellis radicata]|nr:hypothetical protein BDZ89DRAFT_385454 [Hymenopellis radicata]